MQCVNSLVCFLQLCNTLRANMKVVKKSEEVRKSHAEAALACLCQLPPCEERNSLQLLTKAFAGLKNS